MTNEELEVLARMATELREKREDLQEAQEQRDRFVNRTNCLEREKNDLIAECNRLRESEANALNASEEAKRERDEARKKFGEWMRFFVDTIYTALVRASERKDCRKIVNGSVSAIRKFIYEHPVEVIEGSLAK